MTIQERIADDLTVAVKTREAFAAGVLRMLRAALKNAEIEKGSPLEEGDVVRIIGQEAKKLRDALPSFEKGGRADLVQKTEKELELMAKYLPEQLADGEIEGIIAKKKDELGIAGPQDFGRLMGAVMQETKGRADGGKVSALVKKALS